MVTEETADSEGWFDWAYKGVDHSYPGNGGLECRDFLSVSQRCWESVAASIVALLALLYAYPRLKLPQPSSCHHLKCEPIGKRILLLLMCLTFGIELGFKFATRQMIWIGNPCHLATMLQIFVLAAPPSRIVTAAFRLQMHMLTGAPIAILFPVINTRLLPFETGVYFLQHILMLIIPFYLMHTGDPFIPEPLGDFSWAFIAFGFLFIYHFLPLQILAYVSQVNLNNMLCPAVSDPFHGKFYRLFAICHQLVLIPLLGKLFVLIARAFKILPCDNPPDIANVGEAFSCEPKCCCKNLCFSSNITKDNSLVKDGGNITDEDSGCCGSTITLENGCRNPKENTQCESKCSCDCSCHSLCPYRSCSTDSKQLNRSCNLENVHTQLIVNGQLIRDVDVDESCCSRRSILDEPNFQPGILQTTVRSKNCSHRIFLLNDSRESVPETQVDKSLHVSDLDKSRNGHAKSH